MGITLKRVSGPTLHKYDPGIYYHICVDILCITNKKCGYSRMVKFLFAKEKMRVRFPLSAQDQDKVNEIPHLEAHLLRNLDKNGIVMLGSWVETGDILVGKLTPQMVKESSYAPEDRLLRAILGIQVSTSKETCLKLPIGGRGRVIDVRWIQKRGGSSYKPETIRVYISQKREIKVGDKVADCEPILGYLHRGMEKIAENRTTIQYLPYVTRWDYLAGHFPFL
ncbi:hypothetical protein CASFOL_007804 [Castilleja foliolosa]|uniref:DNA-directed RNA polymerase n=1 Tax=Castilleja foliolosa TaxID=1961234 RepID=A0ABD3E1K8_9LAMI